MSAEALPEIPDVIGEVRGYRSWKFNPAGWLESSVSDYIWKPGINTAACTQGHRYGTILFLPGPIAVGGRQPGKLHAAPKKDCTCGLYACTDPGSDEIHAGIRGVVEMSGVIIEHERNAVVRAEKARIVAVAMPSAAYRPYQVARVKARYPGVSVYRSEDKMLEDYPPAVPSPAWKERATARHRKQRRWKLAYSAIGALQIGAGGWDFSVAARTPGHGYAWFDIPAGILFTVMGYMNIRCEQGFGGALGRAMTRQILRRAAKKGGP